MAGQPQIVQQPVIKYVDQYGNPVAPPSQQPNIQYVQAPIQPQPQPQPQPVQPTANIVPSDGGVAPPPVYNANAPEQEPPAYNSEAVSEPDGAAPPPAYGQVMSTNGGPSGYQQ